MKKISSSLLSLFVLVTFLAACSSKTTIRVMDPSVKVYIDGEYKGVGSVVHSDKKIVGSTTSVRLEKEGCMPITNSFSRNEEFNVGACIGGVFLLFPFLWIMDYKADRTFEFTCQKVPK